MISEPVALYYDSADIFQHAYNGAGGAPADLKQGPALKTRHGPNLYCLS